MGVFRASTILLKQEPVLMELINTKFWQVAEIREVFFYHPHITWYEFQGTGIKKDSTEYEIIFKRDLKGKIEIDQVNEINAS